MSDSITSSHTESALRRIRWLHLALRAATQVALLPLLIGFVVVGNAAGLEDSSTAVVSSAALLLAQVLLFLRVWRRWPVLEELPPDVKPTRLDRFSHKLVIPGSTAAWQLWVVVGSTFGIALLLLKLLEAESIPARIVAGLLLTAGLAYVMSTLWRRGARQQILGARTTVTEALQQATLIAFLAAAAFAFCTNELHRAGVVELTKSGKEVTTVDSGASFWFYGWHLIDALPTSPLSTLKIDAPYDYEQTLVGALLLAYTFLVVTPFLTLAKEIVARRRRVSAGNEGDPGGGQRPTDVDAADT